MIMPRLGQGTWHLGEDPATRAEELAALRLGLDLGLTLIDTAEMYGDGAAEELVAEAIAGRREEVFLVDKVLPGNAGRAGTVEACHRSLRRLGTDHIDLYLLHWRGGCDLTGTVEAFTELVSAGRIGRWGVSNFDLPDLDDLLAVEGGWRCAANQILYNPGRRGPEFALLPRCRQAGVRVMAYSPLEQGDLLDEPVLGELARDHHATPAQILLAWALHRDGLVVVPRSGNPVHVRENAGAREVRLSAADLAALDVTFPPPAGPETLEVL